jgi:transposase-like protein
MSKGVMSTRRLGGPAGAVHWSAAVARAILARVESGETLTSICQDAEMPHRATLSIWIRRLPVFAAKLERARTAAGWHLKGGHPPKWDPVTAATVVARLCEGETMTQVCADPDMPSFTTVWKWRRAYPEFGEAVALARQIQAERFCDLGWEIASAVTPQDAYATHVKLAQLRWTAAALAPKRYGRFKAVEAEEDVLDDAAEADAGPREVVFRVKHFERIVGPDGKAYVREVPELGAAE